VTRQPKSCYATADLLTHISRKGAGETGAKCPAAHNTPASASQQHTGTAPTHRLNRLNPPRTPSTAGCKKRRHKKNLSAFFSLFFPAAGRFLLTATRKRKGNEETGARQLLCRGSLHFPPFFLLLLCSRT